MFGWYTKNISIFIFEIFVIISRVQEISYYFKLLRVQNRAVAQLG